MAMTRFVLLCWRNTKTLPLRARFTSKQCLSLSFSLSLSLSLSLSGKTVEHTRWGGRATHTHTHTHTHTPDWKRSLLTSFDSCSRNCYMTVNYTKVKAPGDSWLHLLSLCWQDALFGEAVWWSSDVSGHLLVGRSICRPNTLAETDLRLTSESNRHECWLWRSIDFSSCLIWSIRTGL